LSHRAQAYFFIQRFFNCTQRIGPPFTLSHVYFMYKFGSSLTISTSIAPSSSRCKVPSIPACYNDPGTSVTMMYLYSLEFIVHDTMIACRKTVC